MNMDTETHPFVDVPLEKRPNYKEWRVTKDSIEIRVVNWFPSLNLWVLPISSSTERKSIDQRR